MENTKTKVKVDLISGFLGAGKTTFIKGYCEWLNKNNQTFGIIENEFGVAGVDTAILIDGGLSSFELAGGCICCSLKINFHDTILKLSEKYDRIIVEPSGIYNVDEFFTIMDSPKIQEKCEIGTIITIVDPDSLDKMSTQDYNVLYSQLVNTGVVIFSKTQNFTPEEIKRSIQNLNTLLEKELQENDDQLIVETTPWNEFKDEDYNRISKMKFKRYSHEKIYINHNTIFQSTTIYPKEIYTGNRIKKCLKQLSNGKSGNILRIKGYVRGEKDKYTLINSTLSSTIIEENCDERLPMINIIGRNLKRKFIKSIFI